MRYPYPFIISSLIPMWSIFIFIFGACAGSFLNVCIWRIPRDESIISPPSHCPNCGYNLSWYENIPLLSWIILQGKCRNCKNPISFRYFYVEFLTASLFFAVWLKLVLSCQPLALLPLYLLVTMLIVLTTFIDAEHRIIPNEITYPVMAGGLIFSFLWPEHWFSSVRFLSILLPDWRIPIRIFALAGSCISLVTAVVILGIAAVGGKIIFKEEALGWGDVKYLGAVGACLGLRACFFTVLLGSITGSLFGLLLIAIQRGKLRTAIPFGPFLAFSTYVWILFGNKLMLAYLTWAQYLAGRFQ